LLGLPRLLGSTKLKHTIDARVSAATTIEQFRATLQNLSVERFKLAVHDETLELSVYELVVAKGGPTNAGCIVVDKTGLTGKDDFTLYYDMPPRGARRRKSRALVFSMPWSSNSDSGW
jgi:Protein of unknown function (DUF3738)